MGIEGKTCSVNRCRKIILTTYYNYLLLSQLSIRTRNSGNKSEVGKGNQCGQAIARVEGNTNNRTPALINTLAAIATFLSVSSTVHAILNDNETTREKQNPITIACGTNVFFESRKKKIAWVIPRPRYTAINTAEAGMSIC